MERNDRNSIELVGPVKRGRLGTSNDDGGCRWPGSNVFTSLLRSRLSGCHATLPRKDTTFSLKAPSASTVCRLLNQLDEKKATGFDKIPCKLLKLSSRIVGPSLAYIFKSCTCKLMLKSFQTSGKLPKLNRYLKKVFFYSYINFYIWM